MSEKEKKKSNSGVSDINIPTSNYGNSNSQDNRDNTISKTNNEDTVSNGEEEEYTDEEEEYTDEEEEYTDEEDMTHTVTNNNPQSLTPNTKTIDESKTPTPNTNTVTNTNNPNSYTVTDSKNPNTNTINDNTVSETENITKTYNDKTGENTNEDTGEEEDDDDITGTYEGDATPIGDDSSSEDSVTGQNENGENSTDNKVPKTSIIDKNKEINSSVNLDIKNLGSSDDYTSSQSREKPVYNGEKDEIQAIKDAGFFDEKGDDPKANTARQEDFKKAAGIYNLKEEKFDINPDVKQFEPKPPVDEIGAALNYGERKGLDSGQILPSGGRYEKVKEDKSGNVVKRKVPELKLNNDPIKENINGEKMRKTPDPNIQDINQLNIPPPKIRPRHHTEVPKNITEPPVYKKAEWDIINPNKVKPAIKHNKDFFEKNHDYNSIPDGKNSYEKMTELQKMHKQKEEAKREFDILVAKHQGNKLEKRKNSEKYKKNLRDDLSHDTLSDEDFDPGRRDQIRNNIQKLLKNNFRVGQGRKKKRDILKMAQMEQKKMEKQNFKKKNYPNAGAKTRKDPFKIDSEVNLQEEPQFEKPKKVEEVIKIDDIKKRFQRRIVRRRSQQNFHTELATAYTEDLKKKKKKEPKIVSSRNHLLENLIKETNDKNFKKVGDNYYELGNDKKNLNDVQENDFQKSFYKEIPIEIKKNPENFNNNFKEETTQRDYVKKDVEGNQESLTVYIDFPLDGPDGMGWRTYKFKVEKYKGQIIDLKILIERDFGYTVKDQKLFYNFELLEDDHMLVANLIKNNDIWTKGQLTLIFIPKNPPFLNVDKILRTKLTPIELTNVYPTGGTFCNTTNEFLEANISKMLVFPPNRDWTREYYSNRFKIEDTQKQIQLKTDKVVDKNTITKMLDRELSDLLNYNKALLKTKNEFNKTAKKCIELINKWKVKEQNVKYIYGTGGKKFVMGGMVIRECKWIYAFRQRFEQMEKIEGLLKHKIRMMNYLREIQTDIKVPLVSLIEYFGVHYLVYAATPIDLNSLVYGTITQNLLVCNDLNDLPFIAKISKEINCSFHSFVEFGTKTLKQIYLSTGIEIHRCQGALYLTDIERMTPIEIDTDFDSYKPENVFKKFVNFIPLKMVFLSREGKIDSRYRAVQSKATIRCNECNEFIPDDEYFKYEKSNMYFKTLKIKKYFCCIDCYRKKSFYHELQVPLNRLKKRKFRVHTLGEYYIHRERGTITEEVPYRKIPLNPDAILYSDPRQKILQSRSKIIKEFKNENERDLKTIQLLISQEKEIIVNDILQNIENFDEEVCSGEDLRKIIKNAGIPLKFLGKMALISNKHYIKELLVREMVARSSCNIMKNSFLYLRKISSSKMNEFNLKKSMAYHMNNIFGYDETDDTQAEWKTIIDFVDLKFDCTLEILIKEKIHLKGLVSRICELLGVTLNVKIDEINFADDQPFLPHFFKFKIPQIIESFDVDISLKFFSFLGKKYFGLGKVENWWVETGADVQLGIFYYRQASEFCKILYGSDSEKNIPYLFKKAEVLEKKHCEKGRPEFSMWNKAEKVKEDMYSAEARFAYNKILQIFFDQKLQPSPVIAECYISLSKLVKDNKYELIQIDNSDKFNTEKDAKLYYLKKAAVIFEMISGNLHPLIAETFSKISLRHKELMDDRRSLVWMRKALCVFHSTLGPKDEVTERCFRFLIRMEGNIGTKYRNYGLDQLAYSLMENCDEDFDEGGEEEFEMKKIGNDGDMLMIEYGE